MKITVEIDCGERTCLKCRKPFNFKSEHTGEILTWCGVFLKELVPVSGGPYKRLPECIAACKMEGENA